MNNVRKLFTLLNLHIAGVVLLLGLNLFLATRLFVAWHAANSDQSADYEAEHLRYVQLQSQMSRLEGLPQKVDQARSDAVKFYEKRIADNYSTMAGELGALTSKDNVRLTRAQYTPTPAINGLTEVRVDAALSGEYSALMHFINDIERDKNHVFFTIDALTLNGQQGGLVNLRLRMTTYLRSSGDLPSATGDEGAVASEQAAVAPQGARP
ncbi:GspMb/PilO family protein [Alloacidobacterium sp.]|uniref:GspMb/PilO family protein n=1 Tax=Alloacidobacterium sp. TaxID=2951999 RepID=UPI002D457195|nr:GspMb/PilO family protein [Alloacidobacterium sp.]HYK38087.1 GspMb/PilO family protein [Alloacidobacterium sp.]